MGVFLTDLSHEVCGAIGGIIIDENRFPMIAHERRRQFVQQGHHIGGFIEGRDNHGQLQGPCHSNSGLFLWTRQLHQHTQTPIRSFYLARLVAAAGLMPRKQGAMRTAFWGAVTGKGLAKHVVP